MAAKGGPWAEGPPLELRGREERPGGDGIDLGEGPEPGDLGRLELESEAAGGRWRGGGPVPRVLSELVLGGGPLSALRLLGLLVAE